MALDYKDVTGLPAIRTAYLNNFWNIVATSNFYNDCIQEQQFEWLFDLENTNEFMQWICTYISPENILREEEINEFSELTAAGVLDSAVLGRVEDQLHDIHSSAREIDVTNEIVALEDEIVDVNSYITVLNNLHGNLRFEQDNVEKDLEQLRYQSEFVQKHLKQAEHCIDLCKQLDASRARLLTCIVSMSSVFCNSSINANIHPQLLVQMPIEDLKMKYERFSQYGMNFIKSKNHLKQDMSHFREDNEVLMRELQISISNDSSAHFNSNKNKAILRKISQKLFFLMENIVKAKNKCDMASLEKQEHLSSLDETTRLKNDITTGSFQPSETKLRFQLMEFKDKLIQFSENQFVTELLIVIEQFANASLVQILDDLSKVVEFKLHYNLRYCQMLLGRIGAQVHHGYLFCQLLADEKLRLQDIAQLSQEYSKILSADLKQLTKRRETMKTIRVVYDSRDGRELCFENSLPKNLLLLTPSKSSYKDLFDAFKTLDHSIHLQEQGLLTTSLVAVQEILTKNLQSIQQVERILMSGPSKKPVIVDFDISCELYDIGILAEGLKKALKKTIDEIEVSVFEISKVPLKNKRLLWIYFFTDWEKIDALIAHNEQVLIKKIRN